jgi:ribosomal-protein-alanine N-acetyltransferase
MHLKQRFPLQVQKELVIRELNTKDIDDCIQLIPNTAADTWTTEHLNAALANKKTNLCLGLEHNNVLVGFAVFALILDEMELHYIAISSSQTQSGFASSFLRSVFAQALGEIRVVHLEVRQSNFAAIALYQKLGFCQVGVRRKYYSACSSGGEREDALLFHLEL